MVLEKRLLHVPARRYAPAYLSGTPETKIMRNTPPGRLLTARKTEYERSVKFGQN
jgi:hypothetical protein